MNIVRLVTVAMAAVAVIGTASACTPEQSAAAEEAVIQAAPGVEVDVHAGETKHFSARV